MKSVSLVLLLLLTLPPKSGWAGDYYFTFYRGRYTDNSLPEEILLLKPITYENSYMLTAALAKIIDRPAVARQWEVEGQIVKHYLDQDHWEFNLTGIHRWQHFPWDTFLTTTLAAGTGLSYATEVPPLELASHTNEGAAKTLGYLVLEATVRPTQIVNWHLVFRIHHRSGLFRTINNVKGGSNHISAGIKYEF